MESYSNYQMLVPASWVNDLINNKKPETFKGDKYKVLKWAGEMNLKQKITKRTY